MASTATVTAKTGAGQQATSLVLQDVIEIGFDCQNTACNIKLANGQVKCFAGYSTITLTKSGSNFTLTLS